MNISSAKIGDVVEILEGSNKGSLVLITNRCPADRISRSTDYIFIEFPHTRDSVFWDKEDWLVKKKGEGKLEISIKWETEEEIAGREDTGESIPNGQSGLWTNT